MQDEDGFTLVELMVVISLMAILFTLSAFALRHYWFTQALEGAADSLTSQLRQVQQRTDSESAPLVYGIRFDVGTPNWWVVRYNPKSPSDPLDDQCEPALAQYSFDDRVTIAAADFATPTDLDMSRCAPAFPADEFVMFYARGTATEGSVTLTNTITGDSRVISVLPLTGRVRVMAS